MKKHLVLALCLLLPGSSVFPIPALAQNPTRVRVGIYENSPKIFTDSEGNACGFWPDIIGYIARDEGWEIEYVHGTWPQCQRRLEENEIDIMPDEAFSEERSKILAFSNEAVHLSWSAVYVRKGSDIECVLDLEGKNIAVLKGSINVEGPGGIKDLLKNFDVACGFTEMDTYTQVFELVNADKADAGVVSKDFAYAHEEEFGLVSTPIIFQPARLHFAFPKGAVATPYLIETIDRHIVQLKKDKQSAYYQSLDKWFLARPAEKAVFPGWVTPALAGIGGLAFLFLAGYVIVRSQVRSRTRELRQEVAERKQAEAALRESESKYRTLVENLPQKVFLKDKQSVYVSCNDNYARDLGIAPSEIAGKADHDFHRRELAEKYRADDARLMEAGQPEELEEPYMVNGKQRWVRTIKTPVRDDKGEITGILGIFWDITEQKQLEEQFRQVQKLEAIGRLAGGIAHDFNNLLTGIRGFAEFAHGDAEPGSQAHQDLTEVLALADRAANLTRQLLAFSRRQTIEPVVLNMNALIGDQTKMLARLLGEDVDIRFGPAPDLGNVRADPGQIEQVIMNLAVNARDAMPNGGRLTIETANCDLGEDYVQKHVAVTPGPYVMLAISDTGCGMDEETQERLFDPFFTTKEMGKGTGLGLSTVYGIVKQHGGNIWVYSEPGRGSSFKVYLPRVAAEAQERRPASKFITGGSETILLVEDNQAVRDIGRRHLEALGYTVLSAASAREAEQVAQGHKGQIDLLLTDVVMPDRNGRELYESMVASQAGLKVLYMSGYTDNSIVHRGLLEEGIPFLHKPFERESLAAKVRQALEK